MRLERSIERWEKCDPKSMQHISPAAVYFAMQDAKHDIASLAAALQTARLEMNRAYDRHNAELAALSARLAARDAALDAVVALAFKQRDGGDMDLERAGEDMCALLLKHGVHPK